MSSLEDIVRLSRGRRCAVVILLLTFAFSLSSLFYLLKKEGGVTNDQLFLYHPTSNEQAPATTGTSHETDKVKRQINPNRTIELVHVGKTGGSTLRSAFAVQCRHTKDPDNPKKFVARVCGSINPNAAKTPLIARQIRDLVHMWDKNVTLLSMVSSYLVTLRHPIDRLVSEYRCSHPKNCKRGQELEKVFPYACELKKQGFFIKPQSLASRLFVTCFPSPAMEDFVQSIGSPWIDNGHFRTNLTDSQQWKCRKLARHVVLGGKGHGASPHMQFNYNYYYNLTIGAYPEKEVLGVRTECLWEDLVNLDVFVGGDGSFRQRAAVTHGSENFHPALLSQQAYHKFCCVLVNELQVYVNILDRVANFSPQSKQSSVDALYESCGIQTAKNIEAPSWEDWIATCEKKNTRDSAELDRMVPQHPLNDNI